MNKKIISNFFSVRIVTALSLLVEWGMEWEEKGRRRRLIPLEPRGDNWKLQQMKDLTNWTFFYLFPKQI